MFTLSQIIERSHEYKKQLYIAYIDYSKAFDCISHNSMLESLKQQGLDPQYIKILEIIYSRSRALIKMDKKGETFPVQRGVRQGDPISPNLFTALLQQIFSKLNFEDKGVNINGEKLHHLRFADDIVILSENHADLTTMITELDKESRKCGLLMNASKTCVMTNHTEFPIEINEQRISYVKEYTYLGQKISFNDPTMTEIDVRIKKAWNRYWSLKHIFKSNLPLYLKKKAWDSTILPTLLYGCQNWAMTKKVIQKLQVFQRANERSMLNIKIKDRYKNTDIRNRTKLMDAAQMACRLKWRWAGHVARQKDGRWSERVLHWYPREDRRRQGRPRCRWSDDIVAVAGTTWTRLAQDRALWREKEEAFTRKWVSQNTD